MKKQPHLNLRTKRTTFFQLGIIGSLLFVLTAFQLEISPKTEPPNPNHEFELDTLLPPVTIMDESPPPIEYILEEPVRKEPFNPISELVIDHTARLRSVQLPPSISSNAPRRHQLINPAVIPNPNAIYDVVSNMPEYPGGLNEFRGFVSRNVVSPPQSPFDPDDGFVMISFVVDRFGKVVQVQADSSNLSRGFQIAAINAVKKSPKWTPGKQGERTVNVKMRIPVVFQYMD